MITKQEVMDFFVVMSNGNEHRNNPQRSDEEGIAVIEAIEESGLYAHIQNSTLKALALCLGKGYSVQESAIHTLLVGYEYVFGLGREFEIRRRQQTELENMFKEGAE